MNHTIFALRTATSADQEAILALYRRTARIPGGLARIEPEITPDYVANFCRRAAETGLQLVAVDSETDQMVAEIHCYKLEPVAFSHVLGELTIAVDPDYQGNGLGKRIFSLLLQRITTERPEILRVELIARESNRRAIALYQSLGFRIEGRLEGRIRTGDRLEADIPMAWTRV